MKIIGVLLVWALIASACTSDSAVDTTTTTPPTSSAGATTGASLIDTAFGTQAVQDFIVHVDLGLQTDDGPESFYQQVLEHAASGAEAPIEMAGGFRLWPVKSLVGQVVNPQGEPIQGVSLEFALLGLTGAAFDTVREVALSQISETDGDELIVKTLRELSSDRNELLVELVTAEPAVSHTHLSPGDRIGFDLEFVDRLEVGDPMTSVTLFGQTIPGIADVEQGMTPQQLFAYRWNVGLVRFLGADGASLIVDDSLTVVQGSELLSRDMKQRLLDEALKVATDATLRETVEKLPELIKQYRAVNPNTKRPGLCFAPVEGGCAAFVDLEAYLVTAAMFGGLEACLELAVELNRRNEQGGIKKEEIDLGGGGEDDLPENLFDGTPPADVPPGGVSCFEPDPVEPPPTGTTFGDVHVATFDGLGYTAHSVGEFLVYDNEMIEVQMRLEPIQISNGASIATAVAVGVGGHTISLHPIGNTWIDGTQVSLERGTAMNLGGAELVRSPGRWTIVTGDGTIVEVSDNVASRTDSLVLMIRPSTNPSIGMFGSPDGNPENDLVTRDGVQVDPLVKYDYDTFYKTYVDSWRIRQDESLFHYGPGETSDSFLIEGFPESWLTVADLEDPQRIDAELFCESMGVTRADLIDACVFDVALTGIPSYAYQTFMVQASTPDPSATTSSSSGGEGVLVVGDFTVDLSSDLASQGWQCAVSEGSFWALTSIPGTTGESMDVTLEYQDATTSGLGVERFNMTVFRNGNPYAWLVTWTDTPTGTVDSVDFDGTNLQVSGTAFLNEPPDLTLGILTPVSSSRLRPFNLQASCNQ